MRITTEEAGTKGNNYYKRGRNMNYRDRNRNFSYRNQNFRDRKKSDFKKLQFLGLKRKNLLL